jgi:hypothetical protein
MMFSKKTKKILNIASVIISLLIILSMLAAGFSGF